MLCANAVWGGVSIACILMVSNYALGGASGASFNSAVSVAVGLASKMERGWTQVIVDSVMQIVVGLCASASVTQIVSAPSWADSVILTLSCRRVYSVINSVSALFSLCSLSATMCCAPTLSGVASPLLAY